MHRSSVRSERILTPAIALVFCTGLLLSTAPAGALLSYNLSSELKKSGCASDTDGDCLDNNQETSLAWAASPWYFYDEDEDCSGWTNKWGLPSSHFERRDFFQVRPQGSDIANWTADGTAKWVKITYLLLYPHDCASHFGFAGHQGDSESVRFHLYSYDLRTWYLSYAYYLHHGRTDYVSGSFLESRAAGLGTVWASIAADEDSHGSWPGKDVGSSHCAGSMDDFCLSTCDCFINTWSSDFSNGYFEYPSATRNVGGPSPESWNGAVLALSGSDAYSLLDVGHGLNREYFTPRTDQYKWFCGWECSSGYRQSDGHCAVNVHSRDNCAEGPLSQKVDSASFTVNPPPPPPTSCQGYCGTYTGACWCDSSCQTYGDCCADYNLYCGGGGGGGGGGCLAGAVADAAKALPCPEEIPTETLAAAERGAALAAEAAQRLDAQARGLGRGSDATRERTRLLRLARNPVAAVLPMLAGSTPSQQLATLHWMSTVPDARRLVAFFPDLREQVGNPRVMSELAAGDRIRDLIALLEVRGYRAPAPAPGLQVAEIDADAPEPDGAPAAMLEELAELFPLDPEVAAFIHRLESRP